MNLIEQPGLKAREQARAARRRALILAPAALAALIGAHAAIAGTPLTGVVTLVEGEPFTLIRDYHLLTGTRGAALSAGDIVETDAKNLLMIEFQQNTVVAVGPSSRLYLLPRADAPTLVLLRGWLKADYHPHGGSTVFSALGQRLGASTRGGTFVLHAKDTADELFHEDGVMTLLLRDEAKTSATKDTKINQFFVREGRAAVAIQPRPASQFVDGMPAAFRDPLPTNLSARLNGKTAEPKPVRDVSYEDVQLWLAMPRDWRGGFVTRFRPRLKDTAFFSAMDAHMGSHPEWYLILHPPPPEEDNPTAATTNSESKPRPH
jgi:hypothetical protein